MASSKYVKLAEGFDIYGDIPWEVGTEGAELVTSYGAVEMRVDGDERDRFAEAVARAVAPGVKHGRGCGCTPCLAEPGYAEARKDAERRAQAREDGE